MHLGFYDASILSKLQPEVSSEGEYKLDFTSRKASITEWKSAFLRKALFSPLRFYFGDFFDERELEPEAGASPERALDVDRFAVGL